LKNRKRSLSPRPYMEEVKREETELEETGYIEDHLLFK